MKDENINKTIVITYDDGTRMVDFCKDSQGNISKDFYDWYLKEKGEYFARTGMLIVDYGEKRKLVGSFDFTNPDLSNFCLYDYRNQKIISSFSFNRQENLTMNEAIVNLKYFSLNAFRDQGFILAPLSLSDKDSVSNRILNLKSHIRKITGKNNKKKIMLEIALNSLYKDINLFNCSQFAYFAYALMYYISKKEYEEVTGKIKKEYEEGDETIKYIYKYTGYIDLMETKVYRPIIKKDPNDPIRDYQRHIQKWTVRGHYRKTKNGLIWIEPHEKGEGYLEKRIYSTQNEKDLPLIPKLFEVEKNKKGSSVEAIALGKNGAQERQDILFDSEKEIQMTDNDFFKKDFIDYTKNQECEKYARELKKYFQLTDFEALKIAIESQRNEFLYRAFMLSNDDRKHPTAIESLSIALGMKPI